MTEKNSNETKVCNQETSRRSFLKTSAAIAGAAVLGESFYASLAAASTEERQDVTDVQLLFVQNAADVVMKDSKLILVGISPTTIFFSDRPNRLAGHMHTDEFVEDWLQGKDKESFHADPPNATLSVFGKDEIVDVVVELKNPKLVGNDLVYDIAVLEVNKPIPSGPVSLFIDPVGRPLSPGSVAGVRRRTRRRAVRRAAVM
ncbi:MAG: twin-arginine translocation signal domain-containing protein [Desulforhopalus sp.]|nr:twin-arginine translocation signal domain-containing protein [Desulforhopalus sp.]